MYITLVTGVVCKLNTGLILVKDNNKMHHCYYYEYATFNMVALTKESCPSMLIVSCQVMKTDDSLGRGACQPV